MELPLRCFDCQTDSCNSDWHFYLFSCGHLACPLHVMSPTCVHDPDHFMVLDTWEDNFCKTQFELRQRLCYEFNNSWNEQLTWSYNLIEEAVKCYLESQAKMRRSERGLPDVLPGYPQPGLSYCSICRLSKSENLTCESCAAAYMQTAAQNALKCPSCYRDGYSQDCGECQRRKRPLVERDTQTDSYDEPVKCRKCPKFQKKDDILCRNCSEAEVLSAHPPPVCLKCNKEQDPRAIFCESCYSSDTETAACRKCGDFESKANFLCSKCERLEPVSCQDCEVEVPLGNVKCGDCGFKNFQARNPAPTCKTCHSSILESDVYCSTCHTRTASQATEVACSECHSYVSRDIAICEVCSSKRTYSEVESIVCKQCGQHPQDAIFHCDSCVTAGMEVVKCTLCQSTTRRAEYRCGDCEIVEIHTNVKAAQTEQVSCTKCGSVTYIEELKCGNCYLHDFESANPPPECLNCGNERPTYCETCHSEQVEAKKDVLCSRCRKPTIKNQVICSNCSILTKPEPPPPVCQKCLRSNKGSTYCANCFQQKCNACKADMKIEDFECQNCRIKRETGIKRRCELCTEVTENLICLNCLRREKKLNECFKCEEKLPIEDLLCTKCKPLPSPQSQKNSQDILDRILPPGVHLNIRGKSPSRKHQVARETTDSPRTPVRAEEDKDETRKCAQCGHPYGPETTCVICSRDKQPPVIPPTYERGKLKVPESTPKVRIVSKSQVLITQALTPVLAASPYNERWKCSKCNTLNSQENLSCFSCNIPKSIPPGAAKKGQIALRAMPKPGNQQKKQSPVVEQNPVSKSAGLKSADSHSKVRRK